MLFSRGAISLRLRLLLLSIVLIPVVAGFASVPGNTPHGDITRTAAEWSGWPEGGIDALVVAVHDPDYEQVDWEPRASAPARYDLAPEYDAAYHCDRVPPTDNATAFAATQALIEDRRRAAVAGTDAELVVQSVGEALHALQDCFSHSDYVDLGPEEQRRFVEYLFGNGSAPEVRLAASMPNIDEPGSPRDPYPHDRFAKDSPGFNEEAETHIGNATKFDLAKAAATHASARLLNETLSELTPEMRDAIDKLEPSAPDRSPIPASNGWPFFALLALVALLLRR